jgi:hemerythrin
MESFLWDKNFETGLEDVDHQHRVLVDLINRFGDQLTQVERVSSSDLEAVLGELAAYARYHFQEEEGMMLRIGLDPRYLEHHFQLHANFLQEVRRMHESLMSQINTTEPLLKFLIYWLAFHILGIDQSMARQVRAVESGQTAADAYLAEKAMNEGVVEPLLGAVNGLFHQLSERNHELLELNKTLEARVEERTRSLSEANHLLEEIAMTDVLTGLPNRRHAMARFTQAWSEATRAHSPLACMMIDADGFKQINDQYGHDAGDEVLQQLSRQLRYAVRSDDIVCRLGGDEFLIICPGTNFDGALQAAESMRREVAQMQVAVSGGGAWHGSVSVGVAERMPGMQTPEDLIKAADAGVYVAKRDGRNCVRFSKEEAG